MNEKKVELTIEELEERIAPIVHPFGPVPITSNGAVGASGGSAGGTTAASTVFGTGQISEAPVPENTPGVGP